MSYREKTCPTCGTVHKKRGPYCSRSCGNRRVISKEQREIISKASREWHSRDTQEVIDHKNQLRDSALKSKGIETDVLPPMIQNRWLDDHREVIDGDYWIEDGF